MNPDLSSIEQQTKKRVTFSDTPAAPEGKKDKERFEKTNWKQPSTNSHLSLFWSLENLANLDGAEAVEPEDL